MEYVLPGEPDTSEHLDRPLTRTHGHVAGVALRRRRRDRRLLVVLGHAPRRPVRERAGELRVDIWIGEGMRHGLVDADGPAELFACLRVLDAELEGAAGDSGRLQRKRGGLFVLRGR